MGLKSWVSSAISCETGVAKTIVIRRQDTWTAGSLGAAKMAALNLTSLHTCSSSHVIPHSRSPQNTPRISSSWFIKRFLTFLSVSSKSYITARPRSLTIVSAVKNLAETESVSISPTSDEILAKFPTSSGVYAIYDKNHELQFIGITRNIAASLVTHQKAVPELCGSVKAGVIDNPDRATLTQAWKSWMEEHIKTTGKVPPGNKSGNATWVKQPPRKKADLRLTPGRHVQLTVPLEELIDRLVKENRVVAFIKGSRSAPLCGFSQRVIGILESQGVDYESVDVLDEEHNYGLRETLKRYSKWPTFPQIYLDGELVGGCDILTSMYEKGEIADFFKK